MANQKRGFEGIIKYGVAGSTAGTALTNAKDISYNLDTEDAETTIRGDSSGPPIKYESVVARVAAIEWTMQVDSSDASQASLIAAVAAGTPVAIRTLAYSTGLGYDGDMIIKANRPMPLKGSQEVTFTGKPTLDGGRVAQLNV